jgi:type II secretory pathway pseudopilin PulG
MLNLSYMKIKKLNNEGYTAVELLAVLAIFSTLGILFSYVLRQNAADARDVQRKRDVSSIYFQLEAAKTEAGYPEVITKEKLSGIDPEALVDTKGVELGQPNAEYRYFPAECNAGSCKSYEIKVNLEKEAEFIKKSATN